MLPLLLTEPWLPFCLVAGGLVSLLGAGLAAGNLAAPFNRAIRSWPVLALPAGAREWPPLRVTLIVRTYPVGGIVKVI
jgi:hypothetical protein